MEQAKKGRKKRIREPLSVQVRAGEEPLLRLLEKALREWLPPKT